MVLNTVWYRYHTHGKHHEEKRRGPIDLYSAAVSDAAFFGGHLFAKMACAFDARIGVRVDWLLDSPSVIPDVQLIAHTNNFPA